MDAMTLTHDASGRLSKIIDYFLRAAVMPVGRLRRIVVKMSSSIHANKGKYHREGRVTLVGAGPGDPELLTIKALRAIESADVILFDALVSDGILELARTSAECICVGKRGGRPSCRQDDLNKLMLDFARTGKHVVRLKAGDPSIFGRAGEEISYLRAGDIAVTTVPGITAASAMAAAFGISLTHRDNAKSVRFVTGHSKRGGLPEDLDWQAIADASATTVFYMGAPLAEQIAERLIALGLALGTPVGIASSLSRRNQRLASCTLGELSTIVAGFDRGEPLILGIGAVFANDRSPLSFLQKDCMVG